MLDKELIKKLKKGHNVNKSLVHAFCALGDENRYKIFCILMEHQNLCVSDFAEILGVSTSAASQQLSLLEKAGLVKRMRHGQMICYEIKLEDVNVKALAILICGEKHKKKRFWELFRTSS